MVLKTKGNMCNYIGLHAPGPNVSGSNFVSLQTKVITKYLQVAHITPTFTHLYALDNGIWSDVRMEVTGFKDIKTLMHYVKITPNLVAPEIERAMASRQQSSL